MRRTFKPLAHAARSLLGINGLFETNRRIEEKLDALSRPPEPPPPVTKMEAVAELLRQADLTYSGLTGDPPPVATPAVHGGGSRLCRQGDFATDAFRYWIGRTGWPLSMHRKLWEWFFVADALWARGMLRPGSRGLGFGVGQEPLTALFAAHDCTIVATDLDPASPAVAEDGWIVTQQHASEISALDYPAICPSEKLRQRVSFQPVDMNLIAPGLTGFDFAWSACCFEHLGSLRNGIDFVVNAMACLRPGGIAVHTTEFNLGSNTDTVETTALSLYRRRDIEELVSRLEDEGHAVEPIDWNRGRGIADGYVDLPPYNAPMHLRLRLAEFDCTSIGLIVHAKA